MVPLLCYVAAVKRPTAHLPGCGNQPGKVAIGSPRVIRLLQNDAASRKRASAAKALVVTLAGEPALVLPRRWLSRFWPFANGTVLSRASGNHGTFPEMIAAETAAGAAFVAVKRWRRVVTAWQAPKAPRAILLDAKGAHHRRDEVPIPPRRYDIDKATAKTHGLDYAFYRFVRAGEPAAGSPFGAPPPPQPELSAAQVRAGKRVVWVDPGEAMLVFGDADRLDAWTGSYGFGERPCDYDLVCTSKDVIAGGRVLVLREIGAMTWLPRAGGGVLVGLANVDDKAVAAAAANAFADALAWKPTKQTVAIGTRGARLSNAADRGDEKNKVLRIALPAGRYKIEHATLDETYLVGGKRWHVSIGVWRVRR
jgi:hypothetical protein